MKRLSRFIVLSFLAVSFFLAPGLTGAADAAKVAVTVEKLTLGEGFIVEPTIVTLSGSQSAADVIKSLLENTFPNKQAYSASGSGGAFYLKGVYDPARNGLLREFDEGNQSGWMVTVANTFIGTSAGSRILTDGEVMRWQYTTQLGAEFGVGADNLGGNKLANKDALVRKVAEINEAGNKADYGSAYTNAVSVLTTLAAAQAQVDSALSALDKPTPTPTPDPKPEPTPAPDPDPVKPSPTPDPAPSPIAPIPAPADFELVASAPEEIRATWETYVTTDKTSGAVTVMIEIPAPAEFVLSSSLITADASGFTTNVRVKFRAAQASGASVSSLSAAGGTLLFLGTCENETYYKSAKLNSITYEVNGTLYEQPLGENGSGVTIASDTKIVDTEEIDDSGTGTGGGSDSGGGSGSGGGGGGCDAGAAGIFAVLAAAMIARKKR